MKHNRLQLRILIGFLLGIAFGLISPEYALKLAFLGDIFIRAIKMLVVPVLICSLFSGITGIPDMRMLRRVGAKTVAAYVLMFLVSAAISFGVAYLIRPGLGVTLAQTPVWEGQLADTSVSAFLTGIFPANIFDTLAKGEAIPIMVFTILVAMAALSLRERAQPLLHMMDALSAVMFKVVGYVMSASPVGVLFLMSGAVARYGPGIFTVLAKYIACCYLACVLTLALAMVAPLMLYARMGVRSLTRALTKITLMAVSTTSSMATLPTAIQVSVEELGAPEDITKFSLTLGSTLNTCGGACSFCCLAVFVSDFYGLQLPLPTLFMMAVVALLINMAASGIPGGGIVLGASFLSIFGLPIDLMAPISAIYRLLDMAFTTINVLGDVVANLLVAKSERLWNPRRAPRSK